jgi:glycosyltransferase involved in cell wall biosynthesis
MWLRRPVPVLESHYQVEQYSPLLPRRGRHILIPLGLPDDVRGHVTLAAAPARRAIFASNPQRNLRRLVEIWAASILPRVPDAALDVYGVNGLQPGDDAWKAWEGGLLPPGLPQHVKDSVSVHPTVARPELIAAMRAARVMLYLGHKCEAFCLSLAEAQALGVPAVIAPIAALPERVIDGVTGLHHSDPEAFAGAAVSLLTDDSLWRRQHEAALRHQQGITWEEYAERFERALLGEKMQVRSHAESVIPQA